MDDREDVLETEAASWTDRPAVLQVVQAEEQDLNVLGHVQEEAVDALLLSRVPVMDVPRRVVLRLGTDESAASRL